MANPIFTDDQIKSINAYQAARVYHPFTCGTNGCKVRVLRATPHGFVCDGCGYTQDWAHARPCRRRDEAGGSTRPA